MGAPIIVPAKKQARRLSCEHRAGLRRRSGSWQCLPSVGGVILRGAAFQSKRKISGSSGPRVSQTPPETRSSPNLVKRGKYPVSSYLLCSKGNINLGIFPVCLPQIDKIDI